MADRVEISARGVKHPYPWKAIETAFYRGADRGWVVMDANGFDVARDLTREQAASIALAERAMEFVRVMAREPCPMDHEHPVSWCRGCDARAILAEAERSRP